MHQVPVLGGNCRFERGEWVGIMIRLIRYPLSMDNLPNLPPRAHPTPPSLPTQHQRYIKQPRIMSSPSPSHVDKKQRIDKSSIDKAPSTNNSTAPSDTKKSLLLSILASTPQIAIQQGIKLFDRHPSVPLSPENLRAIAPLLFDGRWIEAAAMVNPLQFEALTTAKTFKSRGEDRKGLGTVIKEVLAEVVEGEELDSKRFDNVLKIVTDDTAGGDSSEALSADRHILIALTIAAVKSHRLSEARGFIQTLSNYTYDSTWTLNQQQTHSVVSFGPFLRLDAGEKAPRNLFGEGFPESVSLGSCSPNTYRLG
jgi:hypothetical protein